LLTEAFLPKNWLGAVNKFEDADWVMVGLPYDGTCSYRAGARFAPQEIRLASQGLETYSQVFDKDLSEISFYDAGELEFQFGNREDTLSKIENTAREVFGQDKKWFGIGGEHLVTLPAVKACYEKNPELTIIQFDAHADAAENYLEEKFSHATVIRRVSEIIGADNLIQTGIRSGSKEEYDWMQENKTLYNTDEELITRIKTLGGAPIYLSIDLDVLDPSVFCGTGTPEPGGMSFNELIRKLGCLEGLNIVGVDVVELSPHYDASGVSAITAAKVIREVLLLIKPLQKSNR